MRAVEPAPDRERRRRRLGRPSIGRWLTYAVLGWWTCICLFPLYWTAATSLKGALEIIGGPVYLPFVDYAPRLDAWVYLLFDSNDAPLSRYVNSVVVATTSTVLTILLGGLAIYGLTRFRNPVPAWMGVLALAGTGGAGGAVFAAPARLQVPFLGAAVLLFLATARPRRASGPDLGGTAILVAMVATRLLPPVLTVLPLYIMAQRTGTLDTRFVLIATYTAANLPVAVWLLRPVLGTVATDVEEAAQLDGASHIRILFTIVAPIAARGIAATGLLIFVLCWNEYLFSVYLAADHAMTMPPFLAAQMSVREQQAGSDAEEWSRLSAAILLMIAPLVLGSGLVQRSLARSTLWNR